MTILTINTGTSPNKGDGDSLRSAFQKINANFAYLSTLTNSGGGGGSANLGDIVITDAVISTALTNEDIVLDPNGSGKVRFRNTAIQFDNGNNGNPGFETQILYTKGGGNPVGLGIDAHNSSLRIVGDRQILGTLVDAGLYNGDNNTWASKFLIDYLGNITSQGDLTVLGNILSNSDIHANGLVISDGGIKFPDGSIQTSTAATLSVSYITSGTLTTGTILAVNALKFDTESGFDITDLGEGAVEIALNSTFKYWEVDGQPTLIAHGLDHVHIIAGNGMRITTDDTVVPQSITFNAEPSTLTNGTYNVTLGDNGKLTLPTTATITSINGEINLVVNASDTDLSGVYLSTTTAIVYGAESTIIRSNNVAGPLYNWTFGIDGSTQFPNYTFTSTNGTINQVLANDGDGNVIWKTPSASTGAVGWELTSSTAVLSLASDGVVTLPVGGVIKNSDGTLYSVGTGGISRILTSSTVMYPNTSTLGIGLANKDINQSTDGASFVRLPALGDSVDPMFFSSPNEIRITTSPDSSNPITITPNDGASSTATGYLVIGSYGDPTSIPAVTLFSNNGEIDIWYDQAVATASTPDPIGVVDIKSTSGSNGNVSIRADGTGAVILAGRLVLDTVAPGAGNSANSGNYTTNATELGLGKQVQKLTSSDYYLPPGIEGQMMHFVPSTGADGAIKVWMQSWRSSLSGTASINNNSAWFVFSSSRSDKGPAYAIFTDGAWTTSHGFTS